MDPLSAYLLSVMRNEATAETRRFLDCEAALNELGYWFLFRPEWLSLEELCPTTISAECRLVEEFRSRYPKTDCCGGFNAVVSVFADPLIVDGGDYK